MQYSKERIFQSCNLHRHCLAAHLKNAVKIDNQYVDIVYILELCVSEEEFKILLHNISNSLNTNHGNITFKGFIDKGNPISPILITLPLENIYEIESIESR